MTTGIKWIRQRQRGLARSAIALFALAWLQAAVVPCTMAYAMERGAAPMAQPAHDGGHTSHHDGHDGHDSTASRPAHCPYCPPAQGDPTAGCDHEAQCAFPHDPQIDARTLTIFYGPPPCQVLGAGCRLNAPVSRVAAGDDPPDVPRLRLSISYCRFIE